MLIRDAKKNQPNASVFYVAYVADSSKKTSMRPLTFLYSGGPGSPTIWLHMGSIAPVRVESASAAASVPAPYRRAHRMRTA